MFASHGLCRMSPLSLSLSILFLGLVFLFFFLLSVFKRLAHCLSLYIYTQPYTIYIYIYSLLFDLPLLSPGHCPGQSLVRISPSPSYLTLVIACIDFSPDWL